MSFEKPKCSNSVKLFILVEQPHNCPLAVDCWKDGEPLVDDAVVLGFSDFNAPFLGYIVAIGQKTAQNFQPGNYVVG